MNICIENIQNIHFSFILLVLCTIIITNNEKLFQNHQINQIPPYILIWIHVFLYKIEFNLILFNTSDCQIQQNHYKHTQNPMRISISAAIPVAERNLFCNSIILTRVLNKIIKNMLKCGNGVVLYWKADITSPTVYHILFYSVYVTIE